MEGETDHEEETAADDFPSKMVLQILDLEREKDLQKLDPRNLGILILKLQMPDIPRITSYN
ncbi:unnamed protein product [Arabis nemorensis]|uniref:Uncharacterized protein n=1 Tax=Arabis nemorensis TaxID=586526 RepID=A0A565C629_9BRAS|nr:unnamed protein product [Arabis nemorensis]